MPRHSRGCRNCVHRHILCDKSGPSCKNCQARSLICDGSHQGLHIKFTTSHSVSTTRKKKTLPGPTSQADRLSSVSKPGEYDQLTFRRELEGQSCSDRNFSFLLAMSGRGDQVWLKHCMRDPHTHPIAKLAIEALSTAKFARIHREQRLLDTAAQRYANALVALQDALNDTRWCHFDVLAAITAMNRYEILVCTTRRGFIQHAGGVSKMIEMIGPSLFNQYPYNAILESNRFWIMHEAYYRRKPTFLRQNGWRMIRNPVSDTDVCFRKLQDIYGALLDVAAQVTLVGQHSKENFEERRQTLDLINNVISDLESWAEEWKTVRDFVPCKTTNDPKDSFYGDSRGLVFRDCLTYPTLEDAIGINVCLAFKLLALEWQKKLQYPSWCPGFTNQNMVDIPEARSIVKDICRGLHLHFDSKGTILNVQYLMFTAVSAHKAFHRYSREMRWLQSLLDKIADQTGMELARNWINCYQNKWTPWC